MSISEEEAYKRHRTEEAYRRYRRRQGFIDDFVPKISTKEKYTLNDLTQKELQKAIEELYAYKPLTMFTNDFGSLQPCNTLLPPRFKMTSKTYLAVANGNVIASDENLDNIKKAAAEFTYKGKASVVIYQPILEISPKYDAVETPITLK